VTLETQVEKFNTRQLVRPFGYSSVVSSVRFGVQSGANDCLSTWAHQPGTATSIEVTGQSGQSKLLTVGEHRPGGPTTAVPDDSDVSLASSYSALGLGPEQHGSGPAKLGRGRLSSQQPEAEAELVLGCGFVTHMAGFDGGHGWDNARHAMLVT
jgi:hypothetical protein